MCDTCALAVLEVYASCMHWGVCVGRWRWSCVWVVCVGCTCIVCVSCMRRVCALNMYGLHVCVRDVGHGCGSCVDHAWIMCAMCVIDMCVSCVRVMRVLRVWYAWDVCMEYARRLCAYAVCMDCVCVVYDWDVCGLYVGCVCFVCVCG